MKVMLRKKREGADCSLRLAESSVFEYRGGNTDVQYIFQNGI